MKIDNNTNNKGEKKNESEKNVEIYKKNKVNKQSECSVKKSEK